MINELLYKNKLNVITKFNYEYEPTIGYSFVITLLGSLNQFCSY